MLRKSRGSLVVESLEVRRLFATVIVNTLNDLLQVQNGETSLRAAVQIANAATTATTIEFDPTVFATPQTITLSTNSSSITINDTEPVSVIGPAAALTIQGGSVTSLKMDGGSASISNLTFSSTASDGLDQNGGTLTLTNVTGANCADYGIFVIGPNATASLSDCTVEENKEYGLRVGGPGGFSNDAVTVLNSTASHNPGGGFLSDSPSGSLSATGCTITTNGTMGVYAKYGTTTLTNCSITDNSGSGGVGVVAQTTMVGCTVADNQATSGSGGGIDSDGPLSLINSTIYQNTASGTGGGIQIGGTTSIFDCTIAGNTAAGAGGGLSTTVPLQTTIGNSIIAGNTSGTAGTADVNNNVTSQGYNLIGIATTGSATGWLPTDLVGTSAHPKSANLGGLANNSGATLTMLPQTGSLAIAAGSLALIPSGITTDQRGLPRTYQSTVDIGAVETQPVGISVGSPGDQSAFAGHSATLLLGDFTAAASATAPFKVTVNWGDGSLDTSFSANDPGVIASQPHTYGLAGSDVVTVIVTDAAGTQTGSASFDVIVTTGLITIAAAADQTELIGTNTPFSLGSFSDEFATAPYAVDVDWADGTTDTTFSTSAVGALAVQSHAFETAGAHAVTVTITDSTLVALTATESFVVTVTAGSTPSSVTLQSSNVAPAYDTDVTLTAEVTPATATGEITFLQDGGLLGSATVVSGIATLTTNLLVAGSDSLTAIYNGSATYAASTSAVLTVNVQAPPNTAQLTVQSSTESVSTDQAETFTANVSPASSNGILATGLVTFDVNGTLLGTATVLPGGAATLTTTAPLPVGNDTISASYGGDINFSAASAENISIGVTSTATTTALSLSSTSATTNQAVVLAASIAPATSQTNLLANVFATGTVTFSEDGVPLATVDVNAQGVAALTSSSSLTLGSDAFAAVYNGDGNFTSSTSATQNLSVTSSALVPSATKAVVPLAAVAGQPAHGSISASVTNNLGAAETGVFSVEVIASPSPTLATGDAVVATLARKAKLKAGVTSRVSVPIKSFPAGLDGTYYILLETTDSAGRTEVTSTGTTVNIGPPTIKLSASFPTVLTTLLKSGTFLTLTNSGNVTDFSRFKVTIGFASDSQGQNIVGSTAGTLAPVKLAIRSAKSARVHVTGWKALLATLPVGSYYPTVLFTDSAGNTALAVGAAVG